jgi:dephospho-CoA kinase
LHQRRLGLTGGIATGKSTVTNYLETVHHCPVLDADLYARQAVERGSEVLQRIAQRYGDRILQVDGCLDRQQLGEIVFANPIERHWLEQQIHPWVRQRFEQSLQELPASQFSIVVLAIPLLFEAQMTDLVTEIWVVTCARSQQLERLRQRDRLSVEQAEARIQSQWPLEEKVKRADVVLANTSTRDDLYVQIDQAIANH